MSESRAKELWPGRNAVGQEFTRGGDPEKRYGDWRGEGCRTITLAKVDPLMVYMPDWYRADMGGGLRCGRDGRHNDGGRSSQGRVERGSGCERAGGAGAGPVVADSVANRRFEMDLLLLFAASALLLAGLGVYGVVTYSVVQRQQEIGLRMALGADRGNIYTLLLRDGLRHCTGRGGGSGGGVRAGAGGGEPAVPGEPYDPMVTGGAVAVLMAVGLLACLLPARRAAGVEPMGGVEKQGVGNKNRDYLSG